MKQLSLSLLIIYLILSSNLCLNIKPGKATKKLTKKSKLAKRERKIDTNNNVHLHSIRFSAKLLRRLGDSRGVEELKKEMIATCPTQNLIRTIRTDLINHLVLLKVTDDNSGFALDLPIQTFSTMIQHIVDACPQIVKNSEAISYISAALNNLNPKHKKILKLRKKTKRVIKRLKEILNVKKSEIKKKVKSVNKEIKREKLVAQAKIEHQDVIKILEKLEGNVSKIKSRTKNSSIITKDEQMDKENSSKKINFLDEKPKGRKKKKNKNKNKEKKTKDDGYYNEHLDNDQDFSVFPPDPEPLKKGNSNKNKSAGKKPKSGLIQNYAVSFIENSIEDLTATKKSKDSKGIASNTKPHTSENTEKTSSNEKKNSSISETKNDLHKIPLNTEHSNDLIKKSNFNENKRQGLSSYFAKKIKYFAEKL
jgi:hypothetical protein